MSEVIRGPQATSLPPAGGGLWFIWMVGMWVAFFWLLFADKLDDVWRWVTQLPVLAEIAVWIVFFPWVLGTYVWNSSWLDWLRVGLVVCFAAGWIVVSMPRPRKTQQAGAGRGDRPHDAGAAGSPS
jgi:hypothetical protein